MDRSIRKEWQFFIFILIHRTFSMRLRSSRFSVLAVNLQLPVPASFWRHSNFRLFLSMLDRLCELISEHSELPNRAKRRFSSGKDFETFSVCSKCSKLVLENHHQPPFAGQNPVR